MSNLIRPDIVFPELSYRIVGLLFAVHNNLGCGLLEKYYQKAVAEKLREFKIDFREQVAIHLLMEEKTIANGYVDFIIDNKVILELKRGERFLKQNIDQVNSYLKITKLQLAILANFTSRGLLFKRLINIR